MLFLLVLNGHHGVVISVCLFVFVMFSCAMICARVCNCSSCCFVPCCVVFEYFVLCFNFGLCCDSVR